MNFDYSPEQQALADSVARFVEREYDWDKRTAAIRSNEGVDPGHWATFAELGWLGAGLPEEAGGFGGGPVENAVIAQELGKGLVTEPFAAHVAISQLLAACETPAALDLIEPLVMGEARLALALGEAEGRGDYTVVRTTYEAVADGFRIVGRKSLVEGASLAGHLIVSATGPEGPAIFLVDTSRQGIALNPYRLLDSHRVCDVDLDLVIAAEAMLARGDAASAAMALAVDHGLLALGAEALGVMHSALWDTRDYLKTRTQFGTTLSSFQALQHRMADMLIEVEMTRSLLFHALCAVERSPGERSAAVSALKVQVAEGGLFVASQAIQLHGGIGVTEELPISHYYRRLFVIARLFGGTDMHVDRFADALDRCDRD